MKAFEPRHPEKTIPALWQVHALLTALPDANAWKLRKLHETEALLLACAGVVLDARAAEATAVPGGAVKLELVALNRSVVSARLLAVHLPDGVTEVQAELALNVPVTRQKTLQLAANAAISTPYWLRAPADGALDPVPELALRGLPIGPPALQATFDLELGGHKLAVVRAVRHVWNDPVKGEQSRLFEVAPSADAAKSLQQHHIAYDHVPLLTVWQPPPAKLGPIAMELGATHIGYIPGPGDRVAESLTAVGYDVTLLPLDKLATEPLERFQAILVGIRAFNQTPELGNQRAKLLKYVENGGRLIVQYQTNSKLAPLKVDIGPYPLEIGRERVTDERAAMTPLDPNEPLLQKPNQLTTDDFAGWVQERGLYFAQKWDPRYRAVFAMHDQDEAPLQGGLLVAKYGKGTFVYTGLAFFRQLPAGVPGAYRLLANLLAP